MIVARFFFFIIIFIGVSLSAFAQVDEITDPDEAGTSMPNVGILEAEPIIELVEGVGSVLFSNVAFRESPGLNGKLIRYAAQGERLLLIGESGDWLKVRMYNNAEAYINKKYVRTNKVARDEMKTANDMNKTMSFVINDIIDRFNATLKNSAFARKYKIIPYINVVDARSVKGKTILTFVYSCIDTDGKMIPSYKENSLRKEMVSLLEVIFSKMLLTSAESYEIIIKVPVFAENGEVQDVSGEYASIYLDAKDVNMPILKQDESKIWLFAKSTMPVEKLFERYP